MCWRIQPDLLQALLATKASACSGGLWFKALYREMYKLCGDHQELATPETSREFPTSEATRRTSLFRELRRWLRMATDVEGFRKTN
ncbi:hypothetical protein Bca4012_048729 [Brassica carinata]